jgi:peptide subunit release factor 1 (eRF1)
MIDKDAVHLNLEKLVENKQLIDVVVKHASSKRDFFTNREKDAISQLIEGLMDSLDDLVEASEDKQ